MFTYNFQSIIFYTQINFIYKCYVNILEDIVFIKKTSSIVNVASLQSLSRCLSIFLTLHVISKIYWLRNEGGMEG